MHILNVTFMYKIDLFYIGKNLFFYFFIIGMFILHSILIYKVEEILIFGRMICSVLVAISIMKHKMETNVMELRIDINVCIGGIAPLDFHVVDIMHVMRIRVVMTIKNT